MGYSPWGCKESDTTEQLSVQLGTSLAVHWVSLCASNPGSAGLIPGSRKSPGEGNGNPLQYSCLENPMDRGAWWATVHGIAKSQTRLRVHACNATLGSSNPRLRWFISKESACQCRRQGSIPVWGRSPGEGNGNPLQYSCLENPMNREAWWATVHGIAKSQT